MQSRFKKNSQLNDLLEPLKGSTSPTVISIWGASGSGKSTLAKFIAGELPNSSVFPIDRYLSPNLKTAAFNHVNPQSGEPYIEGLDPRIWDQELLNQHLARIAVGEAVNMPIFDHKERERTGHETFFPSLVTVLEGSYAFENSIEKDISKRILIRAPFHDRFIRKLVRTAHTSLRTDIEESASRYMQSTEPAAKFYYRKYSSLADIAVDNPYVPTMEFSHLLGEQREKTERNKTYLVPRDTYGVLHDSELLGIKKIRSGEYLFSYSIDRHTLLRFKIGSSVMSLLDRYYTPDER